MVELTMRFDLTFTRTAAAAEKKKSSTLRTQPYEAPFFCPPPTMPRKSHSAVDLTLLSSSSAKKLFKKSSKPWTFKNP